MFDVIKNFLVGSIAVVIGLVSSLNTTPEQVNVTPTPSPTIQQQFRWAYGSITESNVTVDIKIALPENEQGGSVHGEFSGFCEGSIRGDYDGKEHGRITGELDGACGYAFLRTKATGTFEGVVYKTKGEVIVNYKGQADTYQKSGTVLLKFPPL